MSNTPIDIRRGARNGYRNGKAPLLRSPGPGEDVLISTQAVIQAGMWRRLPPEARMLMCQAQREREKSITPISEMLEASDTQANATVAAVHELWKIISPAGAVPVSPEMHPARIEALLQYRAMTPEQRVEDAKQSAIRLGGMTALEYETRAAAGVEKTEHDLRKYFPRLAQAVSGSTLESLEQFARRHNLDKAPTEPLDVFAVLRQVSTLLKSVEFAGELDGQTACLVCRAPAPVDDEQRQRLGANVHAPHCPIQTIRNMAGPVNAPGTAHVPHTAIEASTNVFNAFMDMSRDCDCGADAAEQHDAGCPLFTCMHGVQIRESCPDCAAALK